MALVVFTDSSGTSWRVWNIQPEMLQRSSFLGAAFRTGWLCFESEATGERRRLGNIPEHWDTLPAEELEALCEAAALVTRRTPDAAVDAVPDAGAGWPDRTR